MNQPKKKTICRLRRSPEGTVTGEIVDHDGIILSSQDFGKFSDNGYDRLIELIRQQAPEVPIVEIDIAGN